MKTKLIRTLLALTTERKWIAYQMDIKGAYRNRELNETVYMKKLTHFHVKGRKNDIKETSL